MRGCFYCETKFNSSLERRLFCSDICQTRYNRESHYKCFYCGELASDRDHVFPHSASSMGDRRFEGKEIVWACSDCNTRLGNHAAFWLDTRIAYLLRKIRKKYKLDKPALDWDEDELAELSYTLRSGIAGRQRQRHIAEVRAAHIEKRLRQVIALDYGLNSPTLSRSLPKPAPRQRSASVDPASPVPKSSKSLRGQKDRALAS